jgi:hypothetical protein
MQPALFACNSVALARAMTAANLEFAVSSGEKEVQSHCGFALSVVNFHIFSVRTGSVSRRP